MPRPCDPVQDAFSWRDAKGRRHGFHKARLELRLERAVGEQPPPLPLGVEGPVLEAGQQGGDDGGMLGAELADRGLGAATSRCVAAVIGDSSPPEQSYHTIVARSPSPA